MPLGNVVLIPGFEGSHLEIPNFLLPNTRLWVQYPPSLGQTFWQLELNAAGDGPQQPFSQGIYAPDIVREFYGGLLDFLKQDWHVMALSYDWRKSLPAIAQDLWSDINNRFTGQDVYLVGHSLGGVLARFIWRAAGISGLQSRIKRIVTLGSPHWGSYSAVQALARIAETYRLLALFIRPFGPSVVDLLRLAQGQIRSDLLDKILASWPAVYEQFPHPGQPGYADDTLRAQLFFVSRWQQVNSHVTQARLTSALQTMTLMNDPSTQPPDSVLVSVVGRGIRTASKLIPPLRLEEFPGYFYADGDGTVTADAARLRRAAFEVFSSHVDLVRHPQVRGALNRLLVDGLPAVPEIEVHEGVFAVPGPAGPEGPVQTRPPEIYAVPDFEAGTPRAAAQPEPRPTYCP